MAIVARSLGLRRLSDGLHSLVVMLVAVFAVAIVALALPFLIGEASSLDPKQAVGWYRALVAMDGWQLAARNSLAVGAASSLVATLLGTLVVLGAKMWGSGGTRFVGLVSLLLALPAASGALLLYLLVSKAGLAGRFRGLVLAHAALGLPFVLAAVLLALRPLRPGLLRSASSLGAAPAMVLGQLVLPLALPGIASGALLAFAASLAEIPAATLLAPPGQPTLPRQVLAALRDTPGSAASAMAVLLVLCCLLLAGVALLLLRTRLRAVSPSRKVGY